MRHILASRTRNVLVVMAGVCLSMGIGFAQMKSSVITGTVVDASGALIPSATVMVQNQETNVAEQGVTNSVGEYTVPYLPAGRYSVSIKASGFERYRKTDIVLATATTIRVDVTLSPGSVTSTIEVKADAASLQTESSTVQGSVNANMISNVPNINNNPIYYASLQAGVVPNAAMYNSKVLGVGYSDRKTMSAGDFSRAAGRDLCGVWG